MIVVHEHSGLTVSVVGNLFRSEMLYMYLKGMKFYFEIFYECLI